MNLTPFFDEYLRHATLPQLDLAFDRAAGTVSVPLVPRTKMASRCRFASANTIIGRSSGRRPPGRR